MSAEQTAGRRTAARQVRDALFLRRAYDLLLVAALALLLPCLPLLPIPLLRVPLGLVAALIAPGYGLVAALFPRRADLDGVTRLGLSFGLSVAALPVLALLLNALPWGLRLWPMILALAGWILLFTGVALWRRNRAASSGLDYMPPAIHPLDWWRGLNRQAQALFAVASLALIVVLAGTAFSVLAPDPAAQVTEFYALGAQGLADDYPSQVTAGQPIQVHLGITNHEDKTMRYRIEVRSGGQLLGQAGPVALENGRTWEGQVNYMLAKVGKDQEIKILLFYDNENELYRQLSLWVNVRP